MSLYNARAMFEQYCRRNQADPLNTDIELLLSARDQVLREIELYGYSKVPVHLAHKILSYLGSEGLIDREHLLRGYLQQSLDCNERFWANWELVDTLALLEKCNETIKEQVAFLEWSKMNMDADNCPVVMYDGTQAMCWASEGKMEEWFNIYYDLIDSVKPTAKNRNNRATYVRTAGEHFDLTIAFKSHFTKQSV